MQSSANSFTVVIFSSLGEEQLAKYPRLSIERIKWLFITTENDVGNGKKIVEIIYNLYSSQTKSLRIISIDALGAEGQLSGENANNILKYLITSIEYNAKKKMRPPVDVVILPKFYLHTQKEACEIMESLWYLREHTVLISNSSLHATLPSTEVIAVGGATEQTPAQGSVLDFIVTKSGTSGMSISDREGQVPQERNKLLEDEDWQNQDIVHSLGPAVVAAIALNIMGFLSEISAIKSIPGIP